MVDVILPFSIISKYARLIKPFVCLGSTGKGMDIAHKSTATSLNGITNLSNESLPLIHLEFKGFRFMMPTLSNTNKLQHDLLMIQVV